MEGEQPGKDARMRRERQRHRRLRLLEAHALRSKPREVRRERTDTIRAEGVEGDEEDVELAGFGAGAAQEEDQNDEC
jgi:hypothetical protein